MDPLAHPLCKLGYHYRIKDMIYVMPYIASRTLKTAGESLEAFCCCAQCI